MLWIHSLLHYTFFLHSKMVLELQNCEYLCHVQSTHIPPGKPASRHQAFLWQIKGLFLEVLRLGTFRRLKVCTEFVHVVECLREKSPAGIDLHQGQVIQLKHKRKQTGLVEFLILRKRFNLNQKKKPIILKSTASNPCVWWPNPGECHRKPACSRGPSRGRGAGQEHTHLGVRLLLPHEAVSRHAEFGNARVPHILDQGPDLICFRDVVWSTQGSKGWNQSRKEALGKRKQYPARSGFLKNAAWIQAKYMSCSRLKICFALFSILKCKNFLQFSLVPRELTMIHTGICAVTCPLADGTGLVSYNNYQRISFKLHILCLTEW